MKASELRKMPVEELEKLLRETEAQAVYLASQGRPTKKLKKLIARIKTIIHEKK